MRHQIIPAQETPLLIRSRKSELVGLPLIELRMDNIRPAHEQLLKSSLYLGKNSNRSRRPFFKAPAKTTSESSPWTSE